MTNIDIQALADQFSIAGHVAFEAGPGGLPVAAIRNGHASATVVLHGGHILAFQPHGYDPVLWVSRHSQYTPGKAIRGGIPVCWPWFGSHPTDSSRPSHGFARIMPWSVLSTAALAGGKTEVRFVLRDTEATRALWPHAFELRLVVTVGPELRVQLVAQNTGADPFTCGGALHSYFGVSDVTGIAIHGLDGRTYIDQLDPAQTKVQQGPIAIDAETDRIYLETADACVIEDPGMRRRIRVAKAGSRTTVVWNPWEAKARHLADFGDDEYPRMVCVETANAAGDVAIVAPGGEHRLSAVIGVENSA